MELGRNGSGVSASEDSAKHVKWIQRQWVVEQMEERLESFAVGHEVKVVCATWNVNGKSVSASTTDLVPWLRSKGAGAADIVAVGLQEMVDLTAVNVVADGKSVKRAEEWKKLLDDALERLDGKYEMVAMRHLVGVMCCVYCRPSVKGHIRNVSTAIAGVGVLGVLGNKGGVSIRLECYDTKICFVSSHLAAHQENVEGRNADFQSIISKTEFRDVDSDENLLEERRSTLDTSESNKLPSENDQHDEEGSKSRYLGILDHDVVFWIGDLNYRMSSAMAVKEVFARASATDHSFLRSHDQLNAERRAGRVFRGFKEAELSFPVTYKYEPGTSILEQRPDKKLRAPAWCDRVLWKCRGSKKAESRVECVEYDSEMSVLTSDHKPVRAVFKATFLETLPEQRRAAHLEVLKSLAGWEGDSPPEIELFEEARLINEKNPSVEFGPVEFGVEVTRRITMRNVGTVVAHWRFVESSKRWLTAYPQYGTLPPNSTAEVQLSVVVETPTARLLNAAAETLHDVITIHVERGAEYAISVRGEWLRSSWGMSLEELCTCRSSVRDRSDEEAVSAVPKELWRLVDALHKRALKSTDLFFAPGVVSEVRALRDALDRNTAPFSNVSPYSLADAFTSFLASLAEPVVGRALLPRSELAEPTELRRWSREFLARLAPANYNTFVYVLVFFKELLRENNASCNQLTPAKLSAVICNCMLPNDETHWNSKLPGDEDDPTPALWMNTVVQYLLTTPSL